MPTHLTSRLRYLQITLALCFCGFFFTVAVNNCLDYESNFAFVKHIVSMDSVSSNGPLMQRAITQKFVHNFIYLSIIVWQSIISLLMGRGAYQLIKNLHKSSFIYQQSKSILITAFNLSTLLWFYGFIIVGGEWFLMWQSKQWNGQETAYHGLIVNLLAVLIVLYNDERIPTHDHPN